MSQEVRKPNNHLRRQRELRGWTLDRVAEKLDQLGGQTDSKQVGKWERGQVEPSPFYKEKLCLLYGVNTEELGFIVSKSTEGNQPANKSSSKEDRTASQGWSSDNGVFNMKRRELLHLLAIAGSTLVLLPDLDWERIEVTIKKATKVDIGTASDLTVINARFWSLYQTVPTKALVLDGVLGQVKTLISLLKAPNDTLIHRQLCALISDQAQLAGEIFFDRNDYSTAQQCYVFAASAAKEIKQYDLWSCALIRNAYLPIYGKNHLEALPLLQAAQRLASRGDSSLTTNYWSRAVEAEAQAGVGNLRACQTALDSADEVLHLHAKLNVAWLRFDGSRLAELRGACFSKLNEPSLAQPALQKALNQTKGPTRRRAMILTNFAHTALQQEEIDQACQYGNEAVTIASQSNSGMLRKGLQDLKKELSPFAKVRVVKNLNQQIAQLV